MPFVASLLVICVAAIAQADGGPSRAHGVVRLNGERVVFQRKVQFITGKVALTAESAVVVRDLAALMQAEGERDFVIEAHSDASGDARRNLELSQLRAQEVVTRLVALGVAPERLRGVGRGAEAPLVPTTSHEAWRNRRIEVIAVPRPAASAEPSSVALVDDEESPHPLVIGIVDGDMLLVGPRVALLDDDDAAAEDLAPPRFVAFVGIRPIIGLVDVDDADLIGPASERRAPERNVPRVPTVDEGGEP